MYKKAGFTLIELLVVIAIIALLLSVILPSLNKAKEYTKTVLCRSNLRQYGLAMTMYLDDNNNYFPTYRIWLKKDDGGFLMEDDQPDGVFWPYISSYDIHLCPSFSAVSKSDAAWAATFYSERIRGNYSMNSYIGNGGNIWSSWLGAGVTGVKKASEVHRPSGVLTFTEENPYTIGMAAGSQYSTYPLNDLHFTVGDADQKIDNFATYHNPRGRSRDDSNEAGRLSGLNGGSANLVFVDGSVNSVPRAVTSEDFDMGFKLAWPKAQVH